MLVAAAAKFDRRSRLGADADAKRCHLGPKFTVHGQFEISQFSRNFIPLCIFHFVRTYSISTIHSTTMRPISTSKTRRSFIKKSASILRPTATDSANRMPRRRRHMTLFFNTNNSFAHDRQLRPDEVCHSVISVVRNHRFLLLFHKILLYANIFFSDEQTRKIDHSYCVPFAFRLLNSSVLSEFSCFVCFISERYRTLCTF